MHEKRVFFSSFLLLLVAKGITKKINKIDSRNIVGLKKKKKNYL
jgi:hypothetical protein